MKRKVVSQVPKVKKIPQRQCVGCREMKDKKILLRVVRSPEGSVSLDFGGKKPGRGAYVCRDVACLKRARKSRALERAFETAIPPEVYDAMGPPFRLASIGVAAFSGAGPLPLAGRTAWPGGASFLLFPRARFRPGGVPPGEGEIGRAHV